MNNRYVNSIKRFQKLCGAMDIRPFFPSLFKNGITPK
jgi:hypothetical protein